MKSLQSLVSLRYHLGTLLFLTSHCIVLPRFSTVPTYPAEAQRSLSTDYLMRVITTPALRTEFASFIDTVLRQAPSQEVVYRLIDQLNAPFPCRTDIELYKHLIAQSNAIAPRFSMIQKLRALQYQSVNGKSIHSRFIINTIKRKDPS